MVKIDAANKILGRLASEIAVILRGKNKVDFQPYLDKGDVVEVTNTDKIKVTGKKMDKKIYYKHTGYLGHLKMKKMSEIFQKDSREMLKRAVYGMLPKNKLRAKMIKKLKLYKNEKNS